MTRLEETGEAVIARNIRRKLQLASVSNRSGNANSASTFSAQSFMASAPVDPESRNTFTDEVIVLEEEPLVLPPSAYAEIERIIKLRQLADTFLQNEIPVPHSLLLYGPPGCGKSSTARFISYKLKLPLLVLRLDSVISSYLGTTAKNLRSVFEYAARRGSVLFLDEFDAIAKMRDDTHEVGEIKRIVNSLIQNLDSFTNIFVVAATNHAHLLDPAIWRRFDSSIQIPLPGPKERQALLSEFLYKENVNDNDLQRIVMLAEGFSGDDIKHVVVRARQEHLLQPDSQLLRLLARESWHQAEGDNFTNAPGFDEKVSIIRFIDKRTEGQLSARAIAALTGISHSTIARMRHFEGE